MSYSHWSDSFSIIFWMIFWVCGSSSFPISCCLLSWSFVGCTLLFFNVKSISWCYVLHVFGHLVNHIISVSQFTSGLCLTNQSYPKNMFIPFKSMTAVSICSLCLLISTSSNVNYVTFPFFVPSILKTSNNLFIGSILIFSSLTSYLLQLVPREYSMELDWGYNNMISCAGIVSVSTSYSRCYNLISSSLFSHALWLICFMDYSLFCYVLLVYIA